MTFKTSTTGSEATKNLGKAIARQLKGGEVIELVGDLGSGKTTLVQGLAAGLGFKGQVPSPTFTLERVYPVRDNLKLHHFDFYRIDGNDIVGQELNEAMSAKGQIVAIEWAQRGYVKLPNDRLQVNFVPSEKESRTITVSGLGPKSQLIVQKLQ